jgi:glutamine---fructose-6-phosphate transaminase (isomerizing)
VCGIVGYVGEENRCLEVLTEGLRRLEYRGYDSAGIALHLGERIVAIKRAGRLQKLRGALLEEQNGNLLRARGGVGHTRWATHGPPSEANAHPHLGGGGTVAVVHNGIIENYCELKEELVGRGVLFSSETDTEVIAHLLAQRVQAGEALREALGATLGRLRGSFAIAAMSVCEPGKVLAARHQSPLVVGLGSKENFLASSVQALLEHTREFLAIENDEIVELTDSSVALYTLTGEPVRREVFLVEWEQESTELGGFEDYMLKEIYEQPAALRATLEGHLGTDGGVDLCGLELDLAAVERVAIVACGTAYHAGLLAEQAIERLARVPVEVWVASEYRYAQPIVDERTLLIAISQSGETTDTLGALQRARELGGRVLALTNTQGSLITREAEAVLLTRAGPEVGVAATKTFLTQIAALHLLALSLARAKGRVAEEELLKYGRHLRLVPQKVEQTLGLLEGHLDGAVELFEGARCALYLGRGTSYPVALEGALKLKEISYLPAEGYPAGEMKHGPIALVDERCPVVGVVGEGMVREKTLSNIEETEARGARVVAVASKGDEAARRMGRVVLPVAKVEEIVGPYVRSVALQMLAYGVAKERGLDVDKPRNLAKSVTVE